MDPTTLVTFLFKAPPEARTIELLGSWDNFSQPYRMHHDRRRGLGFWSGCFKFHNIIFDGDQPNWHRPRTGGLKQGGTYWYYYRLDDDVEAFDDSREFTTACPLLPGQSVNVIDVPIEVLEPPTRSRSASLDAALSLARVPTTHTLEPGDKFAALDPPPISKVHARCRSELALVGRPESDAQSSSSPNEVQPEDVESELPVKPLAVGERYYASGQFADDRSYLSSRQSWDSVVSSVAHSSVVDAYEVDSFAVPPDAVPALPFAAAPPMPVRAPPSVPSESLPQMPLRAPPGIPVAPAEPIDNQTIVTSVEEADLEEYDQSRFEFPSYASRSLLEQIPEDASEPSRPSSPNPYDSDSHSTRSFNPPRQREALRLDLHHLTHPIAVAAKDFQTPSPSHHHHHHDHRPDSSPCDSSDGTHNDYRPRHLSNSHSNSTSNSDYDGDIWSPTFSAATMSSRDGGDVNTPFRISIGHLRSSAFADFFGEDCVEKVAERLRSLGTEDNSVMGFPAPTIPEVEEVAALGGYALPREPDIGVGAKDGMMETVYGRKSDLVKPAAITTTTFADSIFSELSYLGTSIA